ncbi:MAG: transcriptional regulator, AraC family [Chthonomonadaceae bacterium]|nr:transcriptional regulator, AraC family [Chthonomonadaceae bacterium]
MKRTRELKPMQVFTDAPAQYIRRPDGHLDFLAPCNVLVRHEAMKSERPQAQTRLSLRCSFHGKRYFEVDRQQFVVHDDRYLLFNLGQRVSETVDSTDPVECLNVTFQPECAEEVFRSLVSPTDRLLDSPAGVPSQSLHFFTQTYPHDDLISPILSQFRNLPEGGMVERGWLTEQFHLLLERLVQLHLRVLKETEAVPAMRRSTRIEIYQRLALARDFIEASLDRPITLTDYSGVACLSPHHFLRLFRQVYGETPHQFLTRLRLKTAMDLLQKTETPVTEICFLVGFESLGSFSSLFKRHYGRSPVAFRLPS